MNASTIVYLSSRVSPVARFFSLTGMLLKAICALLPHPRSPGVARVGDRCGLILPATAAVRVASHWTKTSMHVARKLQREFPPVSSYRSEGNYDSHTRGDIRHQTAVTGVNSQYWSCCFPLWRVALRRP